MVLRARQFEFVFPRPALIMGVVNATPDSFSDGGESFTVDKAVARALKLAAEGADIIDIGGESTRPGAEAVPVNEELRRVLPVIQELAGRLAIPLSIDTMKPEVAHAAVEAGASIVNDIAANREDDEMSCVVAQTGAAYVLMHMQGNPRDMQKNPVYKDVVAEVNDFFGQRLSRLAARSVKPEQVILDVGIGFGKRLEDNLQLLAHLSVFSRWGRPVLLGVSRKSFMGKLLGLETPDRLPASLACACWAVERGVSLIRTHDVAATRQALAMTRSLLDRQLNGQRLTNSQ